MSNYDSTEELYANWYFSELQEAGYIKRYQLHSGAYTLSEPIKYNYDKHLKTKTKKMETTLLSGHIFSPDFLIEWNNNARGFFFLSISDQLNLKKVPFIAQEIPDGNKNYFSIVEVKAGFSKFNMDRVFSLNQKWMMQRFGVYVNKTIISNKKGLFKDTFTPERYLMTDKSNKRRSLHYEPRTLQEFIAN